MRGMSSRDSTGKWTVIGLAVVLVATIIVYTFHLGLGEPEFVIDEAKCTGGLNAFIQEFSDISISIRNVGTKTAYNVTILFGDQEWNCGDLQPNQTVKCTLLGGEKLYCDVVAVTYDNERRTVWFDIPWVNPNDHRSETIEDIRPRK